MKPILLLLNLLILCNFTIAQTTSCNTDHHKIVQPFLGEWEEYTVTDTAEVYIGKLTTRLNTEGCVLTQTFMSPDSSFSYHSQGHINPASNMWEETYVFNSGGYSKFLWVVNGESLYTLRVDGSRQPEYVFRLNYTDIKENEYTVTSQESLDGGKTWVSKDVTRIKRVR